MANYRSDLARQVRDLVPARSAAEHYGFTPNRAGFICCPFHHEKTPSLKFFDDGGFKCFGCGAGGSSIDFAMHLFGISLRQALVRLDTDFNLGLTGAKPSVSQREKLRELKKVKRLKAEKTEAMEKERRILVAKYRDLWWAKKLFAPEKPCGADKLHPLFQEALRQLSELEYRLDELEIEMGR